VVSIAILIVHAHEHRVPEVHPPTCTCLRGPGLSGPRDRAKHAFHFRRARSSCMHTWRMRRRAASPRGQDSQSTMICTDNASSRAGPVRHGAWRSRRVSWARRLDESSLLPALPRMPPLPDLHPTATPRSGLHAPPQSQVARLPCMGLFCPPVCERRAAMSSRPCETRLQRCSPPCSGRMSGKAPTPSPPGWQPSHGDRSPPRPQAFRGRTDRAGGPARSRRVRRMTGRPAHSVRALRDRPPLRSCCRGSLRPWAHGLREGRAPHQRLRSARQGEPRPSRLPAGAGACPGRPGRHPRHRGRCRRPRPAALRPGTFRTGARKFGRRSVRGSATLC